MAKKKVEATETTVANIESQNIPETEAAENVETQAPDTVEEQVAEKVAPEADVDEAPENHESKTAPSQDLSAVPPQAVDYLKRHPEVDEIYIDKFGGMFSKNTPKVFAKGAVLYHNPYYKQ